MGYILHDYTLSKTLGTGSVGTVKLATHNVTGKKVRSMVSMTHPTVHTY
jgi:serine/threonine protein kinase